MAITAVFVAGVSEKTQTKVSPQQAAKEVISSCIKEYPDIHGETFMRCIVAESYTHISCLGSPEDFDPKKVFANLRECSEPIQDASI